CKVLFHEVLRPVSAVWLLLAVLAGTALLAGPMARIATPLRQLAWLQAGFCLLVIGSGISHWRGLHLGRWEAPYFFCLAQMGALGGAWRYWRGRQSPEWRRVARAGEAARGPQSGASQGPILNGLFWASSSFLLGKLLVFGSIVILARLLAARAFGEVTLATSAVMVLEVLGTLGLTSAVIFEEQAVESAANLCFWTTLMTAAIETVLGWHFAPLVARFFHEPTLAPMLRVLLLGLLITALGNTHDTLLRRRLAFRVKLVPDLAQAAAKGGAAIVLALLGWGAWSLIWGQVLGSIVATTVLWQVLPFRPRWRWERAVARRMFGYAKHIYLLDGSSVLLSNLDALTIGRMLNDVLLGFYTLAFRIPEVVLISVLNVITRVIFPAFSRMQADRAALRTTLLETSRYTALLTLPLAAGMGLLAPELVRSVYGWHWERSIPVLEVLAIYGGIRCVSHHFGDAYKAMGRPDILSRTTLAWWLVLPPSLILGAHWDGIVGVAWGEVATRAAMTVLHVYLVMHYVEVRALELWKCFAPAFEATLVMGLAVVAAHPLTTGLRPRPALCVLVVLGAGVYFLFLHWRHPRIVRAVVCRLRGLGETALATPVSTQSLTTATPTLAEVSEERAA
ncbi:MAG: lipopolysaccharide biosynthesis protein, partial [Terriglobales bacterium]